MLPGGWVSRIRTMYVYVFLPAAHLYRNQQENAKWIVAIFFRDNGPDICTAYQRADNSMAEP